MIEIFDRAVKRLGLELTQEQLKQMDLYFSEIKLFNPVYKLVKAEDDHELVLKHFVDCLAAVPYIQSQLKEGDTIADLGSGAGFPGIVLAIMFPTHQFFLIERMSRRVDFLKNAVARTGLKNVSIISEDLKNVENKFNVVTCRAFHPLFDIVSLVKNVLAEDGLFCAYKGQVSYVKSELQVCQDGTFSSEIIQLKVPYLDEERCLCALRFDKVINEKEKK